MSLGGWGMTPVGCMTKGKKAKGFGGFALAGLAGGSMGLNFASEVQAGSSLECMAYGALEYGDSMYMEECQVRSMRATKSMAPPRRGKASAARVSRGSQVDTGRVSRRRRRSATRI